MSDWKLTNYRELRFQEGRSNKFYRVFLLRNDPACEYRVVTQWGRVHTEGQHRVEVFRSDIPAKELFASKVKEKERKGYFTTDQEPKGVDLGHVLEMAALGATGVFSPSPVVQIKDEPAPASTSVSDEIVSLLDEVIALNGNDSVPKAKADELMDRYAELVAAAEAEQQKQASTATALDMALTAVMSMAGRVKS